MKRMKRFQSNFKFRKVKTNKQISDKSAIKGQNENNEKNSEQPQVCSQGEENLQGGSVIVSSSYLDFIMHQKPVQDYPASLCQFGYHQIRSMSM